jgi:intraflagellar transport protein 140
MYDEAEKLYLSCKRYDLLANFYKSIGNWEKAINITKIYDKIHLKRTYFQYAQYLEGIGKFEESIKNYEISGKKFKFKKKN